MKSFPRASFETGFLIGLGYYLINLWFRFWIRKDEIVPYAHISPLQVVLHTGAVWGGLWEEQKEVLVPQRELQMLQFIGL